MLDERQMPGVSPVIAGIVRIPEVLHGCTLRLGLLFCKICGRVAIDREAPSLASSSSSSSGTKFTSASARIVAGRGVGRRAWHRPEVPRPKTFQGLVRVMNQMFCGANAKILLGFVHGSRLPVAGFVAILQAASRIRFIKSLYSIRVLRPTFSLLSFFKLRYRLIVGFETRRISAASLILRYRVVPRSTA